MKVDGFEIKKMDPLLGLREREKIGRSFRFGPSLIDHLTPGVSQREMQ